MVAAPWRANAARASDLPDPMPPVSPTTRAIRLLLGERLFGLRRDLLGRRLPPRLTPPFRRRLGRRLGIRGSHRLLIEVVLHDRIGLDHGLRQVGMVSFRLRL